MQNALLETHPGRSCPLSYRYSPAALNREPQLWAETLWIVGGLYGNTLALQYLLDAYGAERGSKALVFNGDFHWFDADATDFELVNDTVLAFPAIRGNVETELATPSGDAGCGCAYPDWVSNATVEHSNRIIKRLRRTARQVPDAIGALAGLPMHVVAGVGDARIGIVHGDASSLAGWGFSQERLAQPQGRSAAQRAFAQAKVDVFACSHTCLPVLQAFADGGCIANNGAAGMPNFRGERYGLATRISVRPGEDAVLRMRHNDLFFDAVPLRYDERAWQERFLAQWPPGSSAHRSYWERILDGPNYHPRQALRGPL
jgi:hypothetical protein